MRVILEIMAVAWLFWGS